MIASERDLARADFAQPASAADDQVVHQPVLCAVKHQLGARRQRHRHATVTELAAAIDQSTGRPIADLQLASAQRHTAAKVKLSGHGLRACSHLVQSETAVFVDHLPAEAAIAVVHTQGQGAGGAAAPASAGIAVDTRTGQRAEAHRRGIPHAESRTAGDFKVGLVVAPVAIDAITQARGASQHTQFGIGAQLHAGSSTPIQVCQSSPCFLNGALAGIGHVAA